MNHSAPWQRFDQACSESLGSSIAFLKQHFRESGDYHRLFDVLKMDLRQSIGIPLLHDENDPALDAATQLKLEEGLLTACREIAELHFAEGNIADGWVYLQPIGDEALSSRLVESVEVTEENVGAIVEIAFNQGVSPQYGFKVMLQESGTCNGITAFDVHAAQFDRQTVSELASVLLDHFYSELHFNVLENVRTVAGSVDESSTLGELLDQHDWLVSETGHHIDATHLASVTRIARQTTTTNDHSKALALARYGCRLGTDFRFASDPPFDDMYEDHRIWFQALHGIQVAESIEHFRQKANESQGEYFEGAAAEALVDLLIRTDQRNEAVKEAVGRLWRLLEPDSLPTSAFEIAQTKSQFAVIADAFRSTGNFAGYAFAMMRRHECSEDE